jgi:N-acetylglucosamine malate deacetylase 1
MKKVLVVSAHPDDEVLGAGGSLVKHRNSGDQIYWLIITTGMESQGFTKEQIDSRQKEIEKVEKQIGIEKTYKLGYPTMQLSSSDLPELVSKVSDVFNDCQPNTIYSLNRSDAHSDHRVISDAIMACTKSFRYPFVKKVLMYECLSETEFAPPFPEKAFIPNYWVDISGLMDEKLELMKIYSSELGEHPFPRSLRNIKALATFRGASINVDYAEAFQVVKIIE